MITIVEENDSLVSQEITNELKGMLDRLITAHTRREAQHLKSVKQFNAEISKIKSDALEESTQTVKTARINALD